MKNFSFLSLLLFSSLLSELAAHQKLLTTKLKDTTLVDIIKLESEDKDMFACAKELWMKIFYEAYQEYTPEQLYLENTTDALMSVLKSAFEDEENDFNNGKNGSLFVVVRDIQTNEIIGFASYDSTATSEDRIIYIRQLAIDFAYRKQGLGKSLIFDVIKVITQNQRAVVTVCTRDINESAVNFYHKLNFQDAPIKDIHPGWSENIWRGFTLTLN